MYIIKQFNLNYYEKSKYIICHFVTVYSFIIARWFRTRWWWLKAITIENQTAAPLYVAVQQFTNFESQPSQTSLIVNQYAEALLPVKHQECIADADYGSCMDNKLFSTYNKLRSSILKQNRFTFLAIKPKTHSSGGMPFMRA